MHYISLDTNTWIYLANGTEPVKLLHYLNTEVKKSNIKVLLPEIVKTEWEIHKEKTVRLGSIKHFNDIVEALEKLLKLLGDKGERDVLSFLLNELDDKDYFQDYLKKFKQKRNEINDAVSDNIKIIDEIFNNHALLILAKESIYKKSGLFALEKKAPFKMKNSFADALILFTFLDYVKTEAIENALFVTYNTDDFCEKINGKKVLHSDLVAEFEDAKCKFYKIVGEALNTIEKDIVSKEELQMIEELQNLENWSSDSEFCIVCQENNDKFNEVTFGGSVDILDERTEVSIDSNQLGIDFIENTVVYSNYSRPHSIELGNCEWCGTEHFRCIDCDTLNAVWEDEYNSEKLCVGCGLNYLIKATIDKKGNQGHKMYVVLKNKEICQKCGKEFNKEDLIENLCSTCENTYSYGEK